MPDSRNGKRDQDFGPTEKRNPYSPAEELPPTAILAVPGGLTLLCKVVYSGLYVTCRVPGATAALSRQCRVGVEYWALERDRPNRKRVGDDSLLPAVHGLPASSFT